MITEDYVNFETAKLLKEKGFEGICQSFTTIIDDTKAPETKEHYDIPTLQMAMKWLREEYGIHILFDLSAWGTYDWYYVYKGNRYHYDKREFDYNTYEQTCEAAIKYCLENLI